MTTVFKYNLTDYTGDVKLLFLVDQTMFTDPQFRHLTVLPSPAIHRT